MGEVVNLRLARKAKRRATEATTAAANRAAFGRTKSEKDADRANRARAERALDGAKRED
ncbi:DUF4169 family protein [uncultured Sphingomonas sp.]|uniref:DUF4169 family protein n=1 Tax=uncultured Sphingomonas sp. TaxID=158754 RepID=UPI0026153F68|nr:DUF4169 family protein [uncultured Sphingomonas sp.]